MCLETMDAAVVHAQRDHAATLAIFHDQVECEIFNEEIRVIFQALLIERVQHRMTGTVSSGCGALHRRACAHILHMAAKGTLIDGAIGVARKRNPGMFQFINRSRGFTHHILDRILITQPIRPFDGIVHVPSPVIGRVVAKAGRNAALRRNSVRTGRKHLGDAGCF